MAIGANVRQGNFSVVACFDDESVRLCFAFDFGNTSYSLQSFLDLNTRLEKQTLAEGLKDAQSKTLEIEWIWLQ